MAFFRHFQDFYPGSYRAKKAPKPHFWGKSSKRGRKSRVREVPGEGFTSTPRGGAPRFPPGYPVPDRDQKGSETPLPLGEVL